MSLDEFQTIERIGGQTIAESHAELSESSKYAIWVEKDVKQGEDELHITRLDGKHIPKEDRDIIKSHFRQEGHYSAITHDGHAEMKTNRRGTINGEPVGAEVVKARLVEVI
jgi:hypothetical protein